MIDKQDLINRMRYASKYNNACPEWVYKLIEAEPEDKNGKDVDKFTTYIPGIFELENGSESINRQEAADAIAGNLGDSVCERIAVDILIGGLYGSFKAHI